MSRRSPKNAGPRKVKSNLPIVPMPSLKANSRGSIQGPKPAPPIINLPVETDIGRCVLKIRKKIKAARSAYRQALYEGAADICGYAKELASSERAWEALRSDPRLWKSREPPPQDADILRTLLKLAFGDDKKVSKYYLALIGFYEDDVPAPDIPERIKEGGGIQKLASAQAKTKPNPSASEGGSNSDAQEGSKEPDAESQQEAETTAPTFKTTVELPDDELQELPSECVVQLFATFKAVEKDKFEIVITQAVCLCEFKDLPSDRVSFGSP